MKYVFLSFIIFVFSSFSEAQELQVSSTQKQLNQVFAQAEQAFASQFTKGQYSAKSKMTVYPIGLSGLDQRLFNGNITQFDSGFTLAIHLVQDRISFAHLRQAIDQLSSNSQQKYKVKALPNNSDQNKNYVVTGGQRPFFLSLQEKSKAQSFYFLVIPAFDDRVFTSELQSVCASAAKSFSDIKGAYNEGTDV